MSPRFHSLRIADVRRETAAAVSIAFEVPPPLASDYRFNAGQYLTLRRFLDGGEARRSYSICTAPGDGELRIAVKRVEGGLFSAWANAGIRPGDAIDVMTPTGRFGIDAVPDAARVHACFAAGSGITPILSMTRDILARERLSRVFLFYGNRTAADMLFREALEELKDRHLRRLSVFHVLSREQQDAPVLNGRLDGEKARLLLRHIVPASTVDHAFVCGPDGMIDDLQATLAALGLEPSRIHVERFVSALGGRPRAAPRPTPGEMAHATAILTVDGRRFEVPMGRDESVLDAALRAGIDLPYACKGGMCSTCRARLLQGQVEMTANFSLEPWELEKGFVLTCQARALTQRVAIDYDQV